jgi:hypothetical protein
MRGAGAQHRVDLRSPIPPGPRCRRAARTSRAASAGSVRGRWREAPGAVERLLGDSRVPQRTACELSDQLTATWPLGDPPLASGQSERPTGSTGLGDIRLTTTAAEVYQATSAVITPR